MSETERLIEGVRAHPVLYNTSHADFKNARKKEEAWYNISESFEGKYDVDWKKKWKNLKDSYVKCLKSEDEEGTRKNPILKRYKNWPWAHKMDFVKPFCKIKRNDTEPVSTEKQWFDLPDGILSEGEDSSLNGCTEERLEDAGEEQIDMKLLARSNEELMEPQIQHIDVDNLKIDAKEKTYSNISKPSKRKSNSNANPNPIHNDIELILMGYAKTIKKFSPKRQTMVKFKFSKILMEAELAQQEEDEADEPSARKKFKNQPPPASPLSNESSD